MRPIQKVQRGGYSICPQCAHRNVCIAIDNQPCTECNQFLGERNTVTHADRIRAMTDEELARFIANKIVNLENYKMIEQGHTPTATQLSALGHTCYCTLVQWLKQPAEEDA